MEYDVNEDSENEEDELYDEYVMDNPEYYDEENDKYTPSKLKRMK